MVGTEAAFKALAQEVAAHESAAGLPARSLDELVYGFVEVANEAMCRPIRALTQMKVGGIGGTCGQVGDM